MNLLNLLLLLFVVQPAGSKRSMSIDTCPVCYGIQLKTGQTKVEYGKIVEEYKCSVDHVFWKPLFTSSTEEAKEKETPRSGSADCDCPVCGFHGYITGQVSIKKCIHGHEFECK